MTENDRMQLDEVQIPWDRLFEGESRRTGLVVDYLDGIDVELSEESVHIVDASPPLDFEAQDEGDQFIVAAHGDVNGRTIFHVLVVDYIEDPTHHTDDPAYGGVGACFINHAVVGGVSITNTTSFADLDEWIHGVASYVRDCLEATPGIVDVIWTPDGYWRYTGDGLQSECRSYDD